MTVVDTANAAMTTPGLVYVSTGAAGSQLLDFDARVEDRNREAWQEIIDYKLVEWGRNPCAIEDDGLFPPSREALERAYSFAIALRDEGKPTPKRTIPDGDGGLAFEYITGGRLEIVHIYEDGTAQRTIYGDEKLMVCEEF